MTLICLMGLPRSGKSTLAKVMSKEWRAPVVNRDSIRLALHGRRYEKLAEDIVRATAKLMVRALFAYHDTVIVDETNLKRSTRDFWRDGEWDTAFLHVDTPLNVCIDRARKMNDEDIQPIIHKMYSYTELLADDEPRFGIRVFLDNAANLPMGSSAAVFMEATDRMYDRPKQEQES